MKKNNLRPVENRRHSHTYQTDCTGSQQKHFLSIDWHQRWNYCECYNSYRVAKQWNEGKPSDSNSKLIIQTSLSVVVQPHFWIKWNKIYLPLNQKPLNVVVGTLSKQWLVGGNCWWLKPILGIFQAEKVNHQKQHQPTCDIIWQAQVISMLATAPFQWACLDKPSNMCDEISCLKVVYKSRHCFHAYIRLHVPGLQLMRIGIRNPTDTKLVDPMTLKQAEGATWGSASFEFRICGMPCTWPRLNSWTK